MINNWLRDNVLLVGILATLILVILLFNVFRGPLDQATSSTENQVNVAPPISEENYKNDFPAEEVPQDQRQPLTSDKQGAIVDDGNVAEENTSSTKPKTSTTPKTTTTQPKVTEKPAAQPETAPAGGKTGIIAIGSFKDQANVNKLVASISAAGLTPYKTSNGGLTRVGVQFTYNTPAELNAMLSTVRKKFEPGAIVIQK